MVKREIEDEPTDRLKSQQIGQQIGLKVRMTKAINEQLNAALRTVQKSIEKIVNRQTMSSWHIEPCLHRMKCVLLNNQYLLALEV